MRFINWIGILVLKYERQHARYMQAFLLAEIDHQGLEEHSDEWCIFDEIIKCWAAAECLATVQIRAIQIRGR